MSVATAPWHKYAVEEIRTAERRGKKLDEWELSFLRNVEHRVSLNLGLTDRQEDLLSKLHAKLTEVAGRVCA